ncbi:hypothetical protein M885DRAFT_522605 [Pelagophyceae sp. CCMP2097]|nr:hypothetical protein M885DRAFT_522605 [Pelagophyceae sp. CCMP2097]
MAAIQSLAALALQACAAAPARALGGGTPRKDGFWGLGGEGFIQCAPAVDAVPKQWLDPWSEVQRKAAEQTSDVRPQLLKQLAVSGRLRDDVLPETFFNGFRVDCLSITNCLAGIGVFGSLAKAQSAAVGQTLVALDVCGCLLLDDEALRQLLEACGATLKRLCVRDCRKLTDSCLEACSRAPVLEDVDIGGNFNMSIAAASIFAMHASAHDASAKKRKKAQPARNPPLLGMGVSGLKCDDSFLASLVISAAGDLRRLAVGFGAFRSDALAGALAAWPNLVEVRCQWTPTFDDACIAAIQEACPKLKALDCLGTPASAGALAGLVGRRGRLLGKADEGRSLIWVNARYSAGPKHALEVLMQNWQDQGVVVVIK